MKKVFLFLILLLPFSILAEDDQINVNNGDVITPIGTVQVYAGIESDSQLLERGYLIADGASLLRTEYPDLFAVIGTTYGNVDATHFNLPNLKGRTVVGLDPSDDDFKTLGHTGGSKTVTLTEDQMPKHTHVFTGTSTTTSNDDEHTHTFSGTTSEDGNHYHQGLHWLIPSGGSISLEGESTGYGLTWTSNNGYNDSRGIVTSYGGTHSHTFSGTTTSAGGNHSHTFTASGTNSEVGGDQAHNNMQPYITMKYIIKVK